ncbi:stressosome-associated protein Prli42 [Paenibacillus stellifer]|nr:stressosome-associated protein Prli42 [Paenibacillus stellifer]
MQRRKWFRIFIYLMLIAMIASTLLVVIEPFLAG